jgi:hypothetical protein
MSYEMSLDISSPEGLSSTEYSGLRLIVGGKTPLDTAKRWYLGGTLFWYLNPSFKETPVSSGSDDTSIYHFRFLVDYRWSERLLLNSSLDFMTLESDFSGGGTRITPALKASQRFQTLNVGISYMF